ncbi:MAG TPA: polymer-forming cytoskeletal protein [Thermoanaerobaculia bacterium]|nr:polymer-forming cytoskeletal protein [Thermoanaerobaculia bacterium]
MSIFRRDPPAPSRPASAAATEGVSSAPPARRTQIAAGTKIKGEVTGSAELLIDGEVEGTVKVEATVVVGAGGVVRGPITAQVVKVAGKVTGNLRGGDRVEVGPEATLEGDISAPRVVIAEGAFFKGKVEMQGEKSKAVRHPQAAEPKRD